VFAPDGGVVVARTVAPTLSFSFELGVFRSRNLVSPFKRAKESFLSPAKAGSQIRGDHVAPRLAVGYGSYAGYADIAR